MKKHQNADTKHACIQSIQTFWNTESQGSIKQAMQSGSMREVQTRMTRAQCSHSAGGE